MDNMSSALSTPVLRCNDLFKHFTTANHSAQVQVLRGLSLELGRGEVVAIVGVSGSGKTTLLRLIAGLERPDRGQVQIDHQVIDGPGPNRVLLFQEESLLPWVRIVDNVALFLNDDSPSRADPRTDALNLLDQVGLRHAADRWPRELSSGERRRVELARAFAVQPTVLLLDEPFSSIDVITRNSLYELIADLWQKRHQSVILTTHDLIEAATIADRVLVLSKDAMTFVYQTSIETPRLRRNASVVVMIADELRGRLLEADQSIRSHNHAT